MILSMTLATQSVGLIDERTRRAIEFNHRQFC